MARGVAPLLIGVIIVVAVAAGALFLGIVPTAGTAELSNFTGTVTVNEKPASLGKALARNDVIRTGTESSAEILFFDSSVARLGANTEVRISDIQTGTRSVRLEQKAGETWNRVLLASGIETYEVVTPSAVASVRGTAFFVRIEGEKVKVGVTSGRIDLKSLKDDKVAATAEVGTDMSAEVDSGAPEAIETADLVRDEWVDENEERDESLEADVRARIRQKYGTFIEIAKSQYGVSDVQIDGYIDAYVSGKYTKEDIEAIKKQYGIDIDVSLSGPAPKPTAWTKLLAAGLGEKAPVLTIASSVRG